MADATLTIASYDGDDTWAICVDGDPAFYFNPGDHGGTARRLIDSFGADVDRELIATLKGQCQAYRKCVELLAKDKPVKRAWRFRG